MQVVVQKSSTRHFQKTLKAEVEGTALHNWQYLFIIEGGLTILFGILAWFWLPNGPEDAWFLSTHDRQYVIQRIARDSASYTGRDRESNTITRPNLSMRDARETFSDWKLYYIQVFNICASVPSLAFSVFLPLVVKGLGYSALQANLVRRIRSRQAQVLTTFGDGGISIALVGLIVTVTSHLNIVKYVGLCILLSGSYVSGPLTTAWLSGNTPEPGKRSLVLGVNGFGNLAGVIGGQLYRSKYAPDYRTPFYVTLGFVATALLGYTTYRLILQTINRRRLDTLASMNAVQIEAERLDDTRYADRKWTFTYGL
ncbi:hypothetical protein N0V94_002494 [Neodidymelliopsis sp. IMI 364377]|nr:hypothetical protein N0V94_002494 [Neodidymelliopsis sp. IMI 364377]